MRKLLDARITAAGSLVYECRHCSRRGRPSYHYHGAEPGLERGAVTSRASHCPGESGDVLLYVVADEREAAAA